MPLPSLWRTAGEAERGGDTSRMVTTPDMPPVIPGYAVGQLLGSGGSGRVWSATRDRDRVAFAVKVVPVDDAETAEAAARELAVLATVDVEGLVGFHEAVTLPGDPARLALVLDHVRGGSLTRAVSARGQLTVGESVTVLTPVCRTLAGLHAHGVVHGDVAPGNVLLELSGRPLLADLGIARIPGEHRAVAHGTPGFVPPEVVAGDQPTAASDVYAVGALAWWCVTGQVPGPPGLRAELADLDPNLPPAWCEATLAALAGDPDSRPDATELALAYFDSAPCEPLRLVVGLDETSLLTRRVRRAAEQSAAEQSAAEAARESARSHWWVPAASRRPLGLLAALVAVVSGAGVGLRTGLVPDLVAARTMDHPTPATSSSTPTSSMPSTVSRSLGPEAVALDPLTDRQAVVRHPLTLVQALADLRAAAMTSGDGALLDRLDAEGSPAQREDALALAASVTERRSYRHVELRVRAASLVGLAGSPQGTRARVDAVVDTAPYEVVNGSRSQWHPADVGQPLRFTLSWSAGRWRIHSVAAG